VLLNELGFDEKFITPLRTDYLIPLCSLLYPEWGGDFLDSHKAFTVSYELGKDRSLAYHYDNAEVTLNVSLGKDFEEGSLFFGSMKQDSGPGDTDRTVECVHNYTYGILHRGQHMHGALPITDGHRCNLIIWMRSSRIRNLECPMCAEEPELVETEGSGDGFTQTTVNMCSTS